MLNAARRGPASIAKSFLSPARSSTCIKSITARSPQHATTRILLTRSIRAISTTPQWSQRALANPEEEEYDVEEQGDAQQPPSDSQIDEGTQHGLVTKFEDLGTRRMVCKTVVDTITKQMGLETMTQVQSLTINETLKGIDVLAQARTGTGKTLAFLIPVLQNIITVDPNLEKRRERSQAMSMDIRAIIISPTRELAEQIAREAEKVTRNTGVVVQTAVGGSSKQMGLQKIRREGCHILVGTPGRLNDLLSDPYSKVKAPNLSAFVLDEADRLLDDGFAPEIQAIQKLLPQRRHVDRQTLLFSATVPREIMSIVQATMKPNFKFVRTVQEGEQQTHEKVPQKLITVRGIENFLPALVELCKRETARQDQHFKALVYFNATAEVTLANSTLRNLRDGNAQSSGPASSNQHPLYPSKIFEIHAKLSQRARTWASDQFRKAKNAILLSSDVTARGMDFPNVTHVIQFGIPQTRDTYIHRIGRTARGDKGGEGWLFLSQLEINAARSRLNDLPLQRDTSLQAAHVDMTQDAELPEFIANILTQVIEATKTVPIQEKNAAYRACLGSLSWFHDKQMIVDAMNDRARYLWGMESMPPVSQLTMNKLGYARTTGLNLIRKPFSDAEDGRSFLSGGSSYGRDSRPPRSGSYSDRGASRSGGYGDRGASRSGGYGDRGASPSGGYGDRGAFRSGGYGDRGAPRSYGDRGRGRNAEHDGSGGYGRGRGLGASRDGARGRSSGSYGSDFNE